MEPEAVMLSVIVVCLGGAVLIISMAFAALRDVADSVRAGTEALEVIADNASLNGQQLEALVAYFLRVEKHTRIQRVSELVDDEKARKQLLSEMEQIQKEMAHETIGQKLKDFL